MKRPVQKQKNHRADGRPKRRLRRFATLGLIAVAAIGGAFAYTGQETVKAAACAAPTADLGTDTLTFNVPEAGEYTVWTRMIAPDVNNNSINMQVDQNDCYNVGGGSFAAATWQDTSINWVNYANGTPSTPVKLTFTQGQHTLKFIGTKAGVQVDKVLVTANTTLTPTGVCNDCLSGDSTPPTVNMTPLSTTTGVLGGVNMQATAADASGIAKVDFLIDGEIVYTDTTSPYNFEWNSASVANGNHELKVQATDTEGNVAASTPVTITTANLVTCSANPSAPANLRVSGANGTSVTLAWDESTLGDQCQLKTYRIFRDGTQVSSTRDATFSDTGLNPGETHTYNIVAVDMANHVSPQSTSVTGTTSNDSVAPSVPTDVRVSLATSTSVALTWTASTDNSAVASYVIYRNGTQIATSTSNSYTDTTASPNTDYSYTVAAKDGANNASAQSQAVTAKTLNGPATNQNKIYITPASGEYNVDKEFTVEVRINTGSDEVNAAQADITYTSNLQFVSIDDSGSAYHMSVAKVGKDGTVTIARGAFDADTQTVVPVKGDQQLAKITFKVLAVGTGKIDVQDSSVALNASTNTDVLAAREDGSYNLTTGIVVEVPPITTPVVNVPPVTIPSTGGSSSNTGTSKPSTGSSSSTSGSTTKPSTSATTGTTTTTTTPTTTKSTTTIAPQGNSQPVTLPNDAEVELSDPVVVQTVPESSETTQKVEYYLNGKLIATIKEPPYSYSVDTKGMKNGTYTLTTKTYYENGEVETKNASLVVKNPMSFKQVMLQIGAFAWVIILVLVIAAGGVWYFYYRSRGGGSGSDDYSDTDGYMFGPNGQNGGPAGPNYGPPAQFSSLLPVFQPIAVPFTADLSRY